MYYIIQREHICMYIHTHTYVRNISDIDFYPSTHPTCRFDILMLRQKKKASYSAWNFSNMLLWRFFMNLLGCLKSSTVEREVYMRKLWFRKTNVRTRICLPWQILVPINMVNTMYNIIHTCFICIKVPFEWSFGKRGTLKPQCYLCRS